VTLRLYEPAGVNAELDSVKVVAQFGAHEAAENEAVVPEGNPSTKNITGSMGPAMAVAVMVADWDCPCVTTTLAPADSEKNKL